MHADPVTQWAFTVVFVVLGVVSLLRLAGDHRRPLAAVGDLLHLAMAAAMVWMVWEIPGGGAVAMQLAVFAAGTIWFCALAWLRATGRVRRRAVGNHGPWQLAGHAVMMAAMVWMLVAMGTAQDAETGHADHHLEAATTLSGIAATAALVVTGVLLIVELVECLGSSRGPRRHAGDLAGGAAMSLGMAAMCWTMLG